ncbi:MAG: LacI family DNA-binding transcriptional regulator [Paracoccaceae bacterium]
MKTPTLSDVARAAGVSYATADRVVNARGGVAQKSVHKVQKAVAALGYVRNVAAANLSTQRVYRFAFVIPTASNAFFRHIHALLGARDLAGRDFRQTIDIVGVEAFEAAALESALKGLAGAGYDGVAVVGIESPGVSAQLAALRQEGTAIFSFVSDVNASERMAYIGIDNTMAGRTAARMVGIAHGAGAGHVQPIVGSLSVRDHQERLAGFCAVLKAEFPQIALCPEIIGGDRNDIVEEKLALQLQAVPQISAVYNIGGGSSGIARVFGRIPPKSRPFCVVHDLLAHTRTALEDGLIDVVIDQRPQDEIDRAIKLMRAAANRLPVASCPPVTLAIYVRDNLPAAPRPTNSETRSTSE